MGYSVKIASLMLMGTLSYSLTAIASHQATLGLKGVLLDTPPCDIFGAEGNNAPIKIDFGEVAIQRIDGQRYRQNVTLTVSCDGTLGDNVMLQLGYDGPASEFDEQALVTSQSALGVRLYLGHDGSVMRPNSTRKLTLSSHGSQQLPLYAVPVKAEGARLVEGKFTASATLALTYP